MFPIMMDEPDAMTVAPSVWHTLESAWRGIRAERQAASAQGLRAGPSEPPRAPSALATLALGTVDPAAGLRH
jgi:hypothetical protein